MQAEARYCIDHVADGRAAFHPAELRRAWLAVDADNRPAAAAITTTTVTFRLAAADGPCRAECLIAGPVGVLRDRSLLLGQLDLPPEVVVPRWYEQGLRLEDGFRPVLVYPELPESVLAGRLPHLTLAEVQSLLERWLALREALRQRFGLEHAGPTPHLAHIPSDSVATLRVVGWDRPPGAPPAPDLLEQALLDRLAQLTPQPDPADDDDTVAAPATPMAPPGDPAPKLEQPPLDQPGQLTSLPAPVDNDDTPAVPATSAAPTRDRSLMAAVVMATVVAGCLLGLIALWTM
ncbi:hypothetical protein GCM10009827_108810 [Dactylosporangium maewongense]|uniref:Uncharacterized protein n=1 Tax=Dactylosporangium maewongense TaxID=634393 RepID=A0ABP4NYH3_9ACTN